MLLNIIVDVQPLGRVFCELFADQVPKTAETFCALSTEGKRFGYEGSSFHRIISGFICQGGDITRHSGTWALYGARVEDENFIPKRTVPGISSMANAGSNTNSSWFLFFICTTETEWLDGLRVLFGKVKENMSTMEAVGCFWSRNVKTSKKTNC